MRVRRAFSPYTSTAAKLLGAEIAVGRRQRGWSAEELAERLGATRVTLGKIERGDPSVGLGLAFEAAALVGVPLFRDDPGSLTTELAETREKLALLPDRVRAPRGPADVVDDF